MISVKQYPAKKHLAGFTLIEVIVALGIIALGLAAVMMTSVSTSRTVGGLKERTFAHWVAMNKMAELHVSKEWPSVKETKGSQELARHEWHWSMKVEKTEMDSMRKVFVRVRVNEDDEYPTVTLIGFVRQP